MKEMTKFHALEEYDDLMVIVDEDNVTYDVTRVVNRLNDLEETRLRHKKTIKKYKDREDRFQRVIGGLMAYLELRIGEKLWWDWNEE